MTKIGDLTYKIRTNHKKRNDFAKVTNYFKEEFVEFFRSLKENLNLMILKQGKRIFEFKQPVILEKNKDFQHILNSDSDLLLLTVLADFQPVHPSDFVGF